MLNLAPIMEFKTNSVSSLEVVYVVPPSWRYKIYYSGLNFFHSIDTFWYISQLSSHGYTNFIHPSAGVPNKNMCTDQFLKKRGSQTISVELNVFEDRNRTDVLRPSKYSIEHFVIQYPPLIRITLGKHKNENNNRMI